MAFTNNNARSSSDAQRFIDDVFSADSMTLSRRTQQPLVPSKKLADPVLSCPMSTFGAASDLFKSNSKKISAGKGKKRSASSVASSGEANAAAKKRPKRPLTPYNLFFRYQRARLLIAAEENVDIDNNAFDSDPLSLPCDSETKVSLVRDFLANNPFAVDNRTRSHRKTHGKLGFQEMVSVISKKWKDADEETTSVFKSLADEDKARHAREITAYYEDPNGEGRAEAAAKARTDSGRKTLRRYQLLSQSEGCARHAPVVVELSTVDALKIALDLADEPVVADAAPSSSNNVLGLAAGCGGLFAPLRLEPLPFLGGDNKLEESIFAEMPGSTEGVDSKIPVAADLVDLMG